MMAMDLQWWLWIYNDGYGFTITKNHKMKQTNRKRKENPRAQSTPKRLTEGTTPEIEIKKGEKKEKSNNKKTHIWQNSKIRNFPRMEQKKKKWNKIWNRIIKYKKQKQNKSTKHKHTQKSSFPTAKVQKQQIKTTTLKQQN